MPDIISRGILNGCQVHDYGNLAMPGRAKWIGVQGLALSVDSGVYVFDNVAMSFAGVQLLQLVPGDQVNPRWDVVVLNNTSGYSVIMGTPTAPDINGSVPMPIIPSTYFGIAQIYVRAQQDPSWTGVVA
jgi:hypothetical protein